MQMHVHALYSHAENQRIVAINDWHHADAPRFFLGRTDQGNVWRFREDLSESVCAELAVLCKKESPTRADRPEHESAYVRILARSAPVERTWFGPAYWLSSSAQVANGTVFITERNLHLLRGGFEDWLPDVPHQQPFVATIVDGKAVAVCASVRVTDAAHEAGVETLARHRRRGYAAAAVSSWASAVQRAGAVALYSTSSDNVASQRVAARMGMTRYGVDFHVT